MVPNSVAVIEVLLAVVFAVNLRGFKISLFTESTKGTSL